MSEEQLSNAVNDFARSVFNDFEEKVFAARDVEYAYNNYYLQLQGHIKEIESVVKISNLPEILHAYYIGDDVYSVIRKSFKKKKPFASTPNNEFWKIYKALGKKQELFDIKKNNIKPKNYLDSVKLSYHILNEQTIIATLGFFEAEKLIRSRKDYFINIGKYHVSDKFNNLLKVLVYYSKLKATNGKTYFPHNEAEAKQLVKQIFRYEADPVSCEANQVFNWNGPSSELVCVFYILSHEFYKDSSLKLLNINIPDFVSTRCANGKGESFSPESLLRSQNRLISSRNSRPYLKHKKIIAKILGVKHL